MTTAVKIRSTSDYAGWPSAILLDNGRILCAYREDTIHGVSNGGDLRIDYSDDDGATWANLSTITNASADVRNCGLCQLANNDVWIVYNEATTTPTDVPYRQISTDRGATWGTKSQIGSKSRARARGKPVESSDGDIAVPLYEWNGTQGRPYVAFWNGSSWSESNIVASFGNYDEVDIVEDPDTADDLIAFIRNSSDYDIYRATYDHSLGTWSSPSKVITRHDPNYGCPAEPAFASNGDLLLAYTDDRDLGTVRVHRSDDKGLTFEEFALINRAPVNAGGIGYYPTIFYIEDVGSDEKWGICYYADSSGIAAPSEIYFDTFYRLSGGQLVPANFTQVAAWAA